MGHVHHPFSTTVGGNTLTALAGWFDTLGYGIWRDGKLTLLDFDQNSIPEL